MILKEEREKIVEFGIKTYQEKLNSGTGGNLSIFNKKENLIAISPSGLDYQKTKLKDVVITDIKGNVVDGKLKPSSELSFHLALYEKRKDISAIVHTHSNYATTLACLNIEIPAVHYLVAFSGGKKVPISPYAEFGTKELANNILKTIKNYNSILLANHGLIALADTIEKAFLVAEEIEFVSRIYYQSKNIGNPIILSDKEMKKVIERFKTYGNKKK